MQCFSVSINKIPGTESGTVKVSQNVDLCKICQHSEINNLVGLGFQK